MVQDAATAGDQRAQLRRVLVDPLLADVLDHADARDRIEPLTTDLAVVLDPDVDLVANAGSVRTLPRDLRLRLRQRDAGDVDVVLLRGMHDPAAPATADVEHALAWLQVELRADQVELCLLRLFEGRRTPGEDRAAVGKRLAEEQLEELRRQVVVMAHRALVARHRVAAALRLELDRGRLGREHRPGRAERCHCQLRLVLALERRSLPRPDHTHRGIEVVDRDVAAHIRAPDSELAWGAERMADRLARLKPERRSTAVCRGQCRAVPELACERPVRKNALDLGAQRGRAGHAPDHNEQAHPTPAGATLRYSRPCLRAPASTSAGPRSRSS